MALSIERPLAPFSPRPAASIVEIPSHVPLFGLTDLQEQCLIQCYCEGHSEAQVGLWLGISQQAVHRHIQRAKGRLAGLGLPMPRASARGTRKELRTAVPSLA